MHNIKIFDVRAVPGDSAFLLDDGKTSILYDTGFAFTGYAVAEKIAGILGDRKLDFIFLTHSHYDHALGSVYIKKKYPSVKIVAGEYAAKIFSKESARAVMRDLDTKFAKKCGVAEYEDLIDSLCVDITVSDGDTVAAGDMLFKAVHLPGHTKCSFGFYLEENGLLLGSETIGVYVGNGIVIPSFLVGYKMTIASIEKAKKLDIKSVLVPHYGIIGAVEAKKYLEEAEKSAVETADEIVGLFKNGGDATKAIEYFRNKFYHGYVREVYPVDAMELNTSIMVKLIETELLPEK